MQLHASHALNTITEAFPGSEPLQSPQFRDMDRPALLNNMDVQGSILGTQMKGT